MSQEIALPREVLEAPFSEGLVKSRPGAFGGSLSYIEGHTVIARLNEAFDGSWSFDVMSHHDTLHKKWKVEMFLENQLVRNIFPNIISVCGRK